MPHKLPEDNLTDRLERQIGFILEIDKVKRVLRRSYLTDLSRRESDAEHSWHLAVMALVLGEYSSSPDLDSARVLRMLLVHDLVEIDAGDSFLYDIGGVDIKAKCERTAADRIFSLLPNDQAVELRSLWEEFESAVTPEARLARALDRLHPLLMIHSTCGKTWKEHGVTAEMAMELNPPIIDRGAPELADYARRLLDDAKARGYFHPSAGEPEP